MFRFNRRDEPFLREHICRGVCDGQGVYLRKGSEENGIGANLMQARLKYWNRLMRRICNRPYRLLSIGSTPLTMTASDCRLSRTAGWPGRDTGNRNFKVGRRALNMLKQITGISMIKSHRNFNNKWSEFRKGQVNKNRNRDKEE